MSKQVAKTQQAIVTPSPRHTTDFVSAWEAPSRTHDLVRYIVRYDRLENTWTCECAGYGYRGTCAHLESAIAAQVAAWRQARKATAA